MRKNTKLHRLMWIAMVLALLLTACGEAGTTGETQVAQTLPVETQPAAVASPTAETVATEAPQVSPTVEATATVAATATEAVQPGVTFRNPVLNSDFPDPFILAVEDRFYAYATNSSGRNIQVAVSENLMEWELLTDAMPALAPWAALRGGLVWAPEVMQVGDQFLLYYTARDKESDKQCVGVAVSDQPEGKFRDTSQEPLVCQAEEGGTIDASPFRDGEKLYLYFKNDGNCCGRTTYLYGQEMAADGLSLVGEAVRLVSNDMVWEGGVVEAPSMLKHDDGYYLFFSGNNYGGVEYAVGYATCETPLGPCEDAPENPILKSLLVKPPVIGPGHQTFVELADETWIVYHAWEVTPQGLKTDRRFMWMDRLEWEDGKPVVRGPTLAVQPVPSLESGQ